MSVLGAWFYTKNRGLSHNAGGWSKYGYILAVVDVYVGIMIQSIETENPQVKRAQDMKQTG
jgi:hypothetical protein